VLHTQEMRQTPDGMRRGWAIWDGESAQAISCCMFSDNLDAGVARNNVLKPILGFIGHGSGIWLTDIGDTDDGVSYHAAIRTRPYIHGTLMNQFECHSAMLLASAVPAGRLNVTLRGDFGRVTKVVDNVTLDPVASEMRVIKNLDDLGLAELRALQVTFEDGVGATTQWSLEQFAMRETSGARAGAR